MLSFITVKVGQLPGRIQEIVLNGDRTVKAAFETAGIDPTGFSLYVNDTVSQLTSTVKDGDRILAAKQIKGN